MSTKRSEIIKIIKSYTEISDEKAQLLLLALEEAGLGPITTIKLVTSRGVKISRRVGGWEKEKQNESI